MGSERKPLACGPKCYEDGIEHHDTPCSQTDPDWGGKCEVCGASPIMPITGMGPCCQKCGEEWP